MTREQKLAKIWTNTHRDFKGTTAGVKTIMINRNGTTLVALNDLTDAEIASHLPKKVLDAEAARLASIATENNPISVMKLGELSNTVLKAIKGGKSDDEAVAAGKEFIASLA
jgi:hypothetical protein